MLFRFATVTAPADYSVVQMLAMENKEMKMPSPK
jgi:hypothetical protein